MTQNLQMRCGPSGWTHPNWDKLVYPKPHSRGFHALEYLSRYFDTAEISSSFVEMPKPEISRLWLRKIAANPQFMLTAKLHRQFTHDRLVDQTAVKQFREGLRPLLDAGRMGALLMQFPWSFRFTAENREFFIKLRRTFHEFPLVAEMRHESWMRDEALGTLIDYRVGFCNIDQPQYTKAMPPTSLLTSSIGFVRLHGRNCFNWYQEFPEAGQMAQRYDYLYSANELEDWAQRIQHLQKFAATTYVVMNNDVGAKSVVNALQLQSMLGIGKAEAPRDVLRRFSGELAEYYPTKKPVQRPLFTEFARQHVA